MIESECIGLTAVRWQAPSTSGQALKVDVVMSPSNTSCLITDFTACQSVSLSVRPSIRLTLSVCPRRRSLTRAMIQGKGRVGRRIELLTNVRKQTADSGRLRSSQIRSTVFFSLFCYFFLALWKPGEKYASLIFVVN